MVTKVGLTTLLITAGALIASDPAAASEIPRTENEIEREIILDFASGQTVHRILDLEEKTVGTLGEPIEQVNLRAEATITPVDTTGTLLAVRIERLQVIHQTFGEQEAQTVLDTSATLSSAPIIWYRSRPLRQAIADPVHVVIGRGNEPVIQGALLNDLVLATVQTLVPATERIYSAGVIELGRTAVLSSERISSALLGKGLCFEVVKADDEQVVATFAEGREGLGSFQGLKGVVCWSCSNPFEFQLEQSADYYLDAAPGSEMQRAVGCQALIRLTSVSLTKSGSELARR